MELSVRPLAPDDFDQFISYWFDLSPEEAERLGVAKDCLRSRHEMRADLELMLKTSTADARTFVLAWCVKGEAIGHSSVKDIIYGDSANMHLHMWRADFRGKGFGPDLFCMSAIYFYERFAPKRIFCEPKSDNPGPNRMLQRVGFPLQGKRIGASSELSTVAELNRYVIEREIAEAYLRSKTSIAK